LGLARIRPFFLALLVLVIVVMLGVRERQRTGERATRAALLVVRRAVDAYRADHEGKCPKQLEELETTRYLADLPDDAWGRPLRLVCPGRREGAAYELSSDGPDGEPGGLDRIE
jgi:general secretion pathway protein G